MGLFGGNDVNAREAADLVERGEAVLLDVREPGEWKAGRAPRAVHIPLDAIGARQGELPRDRRIVTVCRSGGRSSAAARSLRKAGYEVSNLKGGMKAWQRQGLPLEPRDGRVA